MPKLKNREKPTNEFAGTNNVTTSVSKKLLDTLDMVCVYENMPRTDILRAALVREIAFRLLLQTENCDRAELGASFNKPNDTSKVLLAQVKDLLSKA